MEELPKKNPFVSFIAGFFSLFGKSKIKPSADDFKRAEFKTSTQRLGVRFTEKIRDIFRFRWLTKKRGL